MTVAILCASRRSIYHKLPGVVVYDTKRDAKTFPGGMPIVAHPPCRTWSAYCAHQAKPDPGERELGLWCCEQLRRWGGVLEQPADSRLFTAAGLPLPGEHQDDGDNRLWSIGVRQFWWGYPARKSTWLCFSGVPKSAIEIPLALKNDGGDYRRFQVMSKKQRSETCEPFARWLIDAASKAVIL